MWLYFETFLFQLTHLIPYIPVLRMYSKQFLVALTLNRLADKGIEWVLNCKT